VALFRHFFSLVRSPSLSPGASVPPQNHTVFFRRCANDFFPLARKGKWENWERQWLCVEVDDPSPRLRLAQGSTVSNSRWSEMPGLGVAWTPLLDRINSLRAVGLTATMVAADFFRRYIAPLQDCPHLVWH